MMVKDAYLQQDPNRDESKCSFTNFIIILFFTSLIRIITPPLMGHPLPFSPTTAVLLLGGSYFGNRWILPLIAVLGSVWLGDIFIDRIYLGQWMLFYPGFYWQYGCLGLILLIGTMLKSNQITILKVTLASLTASTLFFTISNFGVWVGGLLYPLTKEGLMLCYIAAIPFYKYALIGNLFFAYLLFFGLGWFKKSATALVALKS